jgi:hypothetical protein
MIEINELYYGEQRCKLCDKLCYYNDHYDSYYCPSCNEWKEPVCCDKSCEFCKNRPLKPNHSKLL